MNQKPDLQEAIAGLDKNIQELGAHVDWACTEIARLRGEKLELELKIKNLTYMLCSVIQGRS